ncbi:MAG: ribosome small subunit-dependent GTPase A [Leptospiraceae bacterium]|nr:ribosome small subunit-dependent GTPase A [Leptospiraceae bacterium]MDW7975312.1 ribosome small subunit-dependent GTPase A [Leptospiraceae bacterium]
MRIYRVQEIHGNLFYIFSEESKEQKIAVLRGKLRILENEHPSKIPFRNPCCVGDFVKVREPKNNSSDDHPLIEEVLPRRNILLRASPYEIHPLGSNLDYAALIVSLKQPDLRSGFIDRFLIACFTENVEPVLFFTKCDLLEDTEEDYFYFQQSLYYKNIVNFIYWDNLLKPSDRGILEKWSKELQEKLPTFHDFQYHHSKGTLLLAGQSGTGKSTLTNLIMGKNIQKTNRTSISTGKGRHTTTTSTLLQVNSDFYLIDTPGVKEWGLSHLTKKEIYESYPEWKDFIQHCKFRNCDHTPNIEGCKIQEAINNHRIPEWRKENLDHIIFSIDYYERIRPGDYKKPTGRFQNKFL